MILIYNLIYLYNSFLNIIISNILNINYFFIYILLALNLIHIFYKVNLNLT